VLIDLFDLNVHGIISMFGDSLKVLPSNRIISNKSEGTFTDPLAATWTELIRQFRSLTSRNLVSNPKDFVAFRTAIVFDVNSLKFGP
jgi:hypothetical protein